MNLNYIKCPCKDCDRHSGGCHSNCERYKEYKTRYDAEVKEINKERYTNVQLISMKKERDERIRKRVHI